MYKDAPTDFDFREDKVLHNEDSESCLSCTQHTYWSSSSFLPNIIKNISKGIKVMERTRISTDFCFRGDNYIKKVRVVSLTHDMHTVPPLHPDQLLSNYLKQYGSYDLHKVSASREIT